MPDRITDRDKVTALRLAKGWSMRELARQSGVSYAYIRYVNAGTYHLGEQTAPKVAAALGCTVDDITHLVDAGPRRHAVARHGHTPRAVA